MNINTWLEENSSTNDYGTRIPLKEFQKYLWKQNDIISKKILEEVVRAMEWGVELVSVNILNQYLEGVQQ